MSGLLVPEVSSFKFSDVDAVGVSCPYSASYTSVVSVTGKGMLLAVSCVNNSPRLRVIVDGVTMIDEDGDFQALTPLFVKFEQSLQVLGRAANSAGPAATTATYGVY